MKTHKLSETERLKLENLKLKGQLLSAHKEMLLLNEERLSTERRLLNNQILSAYTIDPNKEDVFIDDTKFELVVQPRVPSPSIPTRQ